MEVGRIHLRSGMLNAMCVCIYDKSVLMLRDGLCLWLEEMGLNS